MCQLVSWLVQLVRRNSPPDRWLGVGLHKLRSFLIWTWPKVAPSLLSHSPLGITTQMTECYCTREKNTSSHSLAISVALNRARKKSSGHTHLLNTWTIEAMDRTSGQAELNAQYFFAILLAGTLPSSNLCQEPTSWLAELLVCTWIISSYVPVS